MQQYGAIVRGRSLVLHGNRRKTPRAAVVMCTPTQDVWQPAGCVSCELVCVCVSFVRVVIICPASTHTALVSSPSLTVVRLSAHIHTCVCDLVVSPAMGVSRLEPGVVWARE